MNVALVDLGSLMLYASRRTPVLPNMGLILRFADAVPADALQAEAQRLASPYGLGRRLAAPRVPGARPRWITAPDPPPVRLTPPRSSPRELGMWLADELSVRHDPLEADGWRMSSTVDPDGATVVALTLNHLFGTGRDLVATLYGGDITDGNGNRNGTGDANGNHNPGSAAPAEYDVRAEIADTLGRLRRGAAGLGRLGSDTAALLTQRRVQGDLIDVGKIVDTIRHRDRSRGRSSVRRVGAIVRAPLAQFNQAAEDAAGNATALQVAVAANLVRAGRAARGAPLERPIRLIVPVDLADRGQAPQVADPLGPVRLTSATVTLPGGAPVYESLVNTRQEVRRAVRAAIEEVERMGRVPVAPGVVDAMRLLPDAVTSRVMFGVHAGYDGAVSSVGPLPPRIIRIGEYTATDAFLMAFPLGSDLAVAYATHGDALSIGVVGDPSRLGAGPPLRERAVRELERWGITASAW